MRSLSLSKRVEVVGDIMAGFKVSNANLKQSAVKAASEITAAFVAAGFLPDKEAGMEFFKSTTTEVFDDLKATADAEPAATSGSGGTNTYTPKEKYDGPPGEWVFTWGKKKGQKLADVQTDDADYISWLVHKDTNPIRNDARDLARRYLDELKAGV